MIFLGNIDTGLFRFHWKLFKKITDIVAIVFVKSLRAYWNTWTHNVVIGITFPRHRYNVILLPAAPYLHHKIYNTYSSYNLYWYLLDTPLYLIGSVLYRDRSSLKKALHFLFFGRPHGTRPHWSSKTLWLTPFLSHLSAVSTSPTSIPIASGASLPLPLHPSPSWVVPPPLPYVCSRTPSLLSFYNCSRLRPMNSLLFSPTWWHTTNLNLPQTLQIILMGLQDHTTDKMAILYLPEINTVNNLFPLLLRILPHEPILTTQILHHFIEALLQSLQDATYTNFTSSQWSFPYASYILKVIQAATYGYNYIVNAPYYIDVSHFSTMAHQDITTLSPLLCNSNKYPPPPPPPLYSIFFTALLNADASCPSLLPYCGTKALLKSPTNVGTPTATIFLPHSGS